MTYRYNQASADPSSTPTYKGKPLKHVGGDTWVLEGHGATISANSKHGGWEVEVQMNDRPTLPGKHYGKDLEGLVDAVVKQELASIKGAEERLNMAKKSLESLGK